MGMQHPKHGLSLMGYGQRGYGLIEVLVATGLLGMIVGGFVTAMITGFRVSDAHHERVTGEALARVQLEYIRNSEYFVPPSLPYLIPPGSDPGAYPAPPPSITLPTGYAVTAEIIQYCDDSVCYPTDELQLVTVRVFRNGKPVATISDLRTKR